MYSTRLVLLISLVFASVKTICPKSIRSVSDNSWLSDMESQIISDSNDYLNILNRSPSNSIPIISTIVPIKGKVDYDQATSVEEPAVISEKPYLLGSDTSEQTLSTTPAALPEGEQVVDKIEINNNKQIEKQGKVRHPVSSQSQLSLQHVESSGVAIRHNTTTRAYYDNDELVIKTHTDAYDGQDSRKILDKILSEVPASSHPKSQLNKENQNSDYPTGSEVQSFVILIRNQTVFIILGCILSSLVFIGLVILVYQIHKKLNERSAITLIAHYEYDVYGRRTLQSLDSEKS